MKYLVIIFLTVIISMDINAADRTDTSRLYKLGEVIITDKNDPLVKTASIENIDRAELMSLDADGIEDAFFLHPGAFMRTDSKNDALLNIRGFDQRQVSVFFDGVPVSFAFDGLMDLGRLAANPVEKITVSKSLPSVLYGANSMGGTVNIITDEYIDGHGFEADIRGGDRYYHGSAKYTGEFNILKWKLSFNYTNSDGYSLPSKFDKTDNENGGKRDNSGFKKTSLFLKLYADISEDFHLSFTEMIIDNEKYVPGDIYTDFPRYWRFPERGGNLRNLSYWWDMTDDISIKGNVFYNHFTNTLESYDDGRFTTQERRYAFTSEQTERSLGGNINLYANTFFDSPGKVIISFRHDIHEQIPNVGAPEEEYSADLITIGAEQGGEITENLDFLLGANFDILNPVYANGDELRKSEEKFNWHAGLSMDLMEKMSVYGHVSRKSRFPTLKEMYAEILGGYRKNPELKEEHTLNFELGTEITAAENLDLSVAGFYNSVNNLIDISFPEQDDRQFNNIGEAIFAGAEIGLTYKNEYINTNLNYTCLHSENTAKDAQSEKLSYRPKHLFNVTLSDSYEIGFSWRIEGNFMGEQYGAVRGGGFKRLPDYFLLNARAAFRIIDALEIYLRGNNLTDEYYETTYGYPRPGIRLFGGVRVSI